MKEKEFLPIVEKKFGISEINKIQRRMLDVSSEKRDIILLSPTGSGKTLAFIMPILKMLQEPKGYVQALIIVPSRELTIQIFNIFRELANGFKVTALYGGHKVEDEVNSLKVVPAIVIATPGRLLDHVQRKNIDLLNVRILVLDEFDKTLELGFEDEVRKIMLRLKNVSKNILTSATSMDILPEFLKLENPIELNFLKTDSPREKMSVNRVVSDNKDKLEALLTLLGSVQKGDYPEKSIIFVNHRESAERVAEYLAGKNVDCILYHGALDQRQRETALSAFNNGSKPILVATDLAARGLDIQSVKNIIHYHQALTPETYTHRNGRTARVDEEGDIYVLLGADEEIKDFISVDKDFCLEPGQKKKLRSDMITLAVNGGKKEKISKGDIVGFLIKECHLNSEDIGKIDVFDHYSLVAVKKPIVNHIISISKQTKLKGKKYKFSLI